MELIPRVIGPFLPSLPTVLSWFVPTFLLAGVAVISVSYLRIQRGWSVPYTRKIFHGIVFTTAGVLQLIVDVSVTSIYGTVVVSWITLALIKQYDSALFTALARPSDRPRETLFIVLPMVATGLGGVISNVLFGSAAVSGYLLCGLGDAVAEPVGERWGRHTYWVPGLAGVSARRSVEGSLSVFIVGGIAVFSGLLVQGSDVIGAAGISLIAAVVGTGVEAISHHGLDNLSLQLAVSGVVYMSIPVS